MSIETKIAEKLTVPAALEQLAEEAAELAQAALKYARILRGENPTPVTKTEALQNLIEEKGDVEICLTVLGEKMLLEIANTHLEKEAKKERWLHRLEDGENNDHS